MIRRTTVFILVSTLMALVLSACSGAEETAVSPDTPQPEQADTEPTTEQVEIQKLFVGPQKVDCEGEGPQQCYQVKENPEDDWQLFYNEIQGFNYEEGFDYEIEVAVTPVENPPAGGSSLNYELVRILNKQQSPDYQPEAQEVTWFVGPEKVECEGEGPQECLQIKENPEDDWQLFYDNIEGFDYEEGFNYEIELRIEAVENPPAGGSSLQYTLIRILNKQPAAGYAPDAEEVTWIVGPEKVDCVGVGPQQCLQIKENPEDDWQLFYDQIEGFTHEDGHAYVIRVLVEPVENPPADASSLKYTLIEILEEEVVSTSSMESASETTFENTLWSLTTLTYPDGSINELFPETKITIQFADGEFNGAACNQYFGAYELDGNNLSLGPIGSTQKLCLPEEINMQEGAYLTQLGNVAQYELAADTLTLFDADGNALLVYEATEPATLTNTLWEVIGYNNGRGGVVSVIIDTRITAQFGEDGTLSGNASCNNYTTGYEVDGENININELVAATLMACPAPEGIMDQEAEYLAALPSAATFSIQDDVLELRTADGALVANYKAVKAPSLPGTAWDVQSYNNGNEAVVSVIIGTNLTAVFNEDGTLSGSAGCNNYTASYEINGDNIIIGPAATTRMICAEPEGIMEQEAQYLAALETAATYRIDAERMEMRTADGAKVADFIIQGYVPPEIETLLNNATYSSEFTASGEVTLVNGEYSEPVAEGSATELKISTTYIAYFGPDTNGNFLFAAVLVSDPGGSGTFYSLHLLQPADDGLVEVAATSLGDRVQINSVGIIDGQIIVDMVQAGEDDPMCCPTEHVINTYELQGNELALIESQVVENEA